MLSQELRQYLKDHPWADAVELSNKFAVDRNILKILIYKLERKGQIKLPPPLLATCKNSKICNCNATGCESLIKYVKEKE